MRNEEKARKLIEEIYPSKSLGDYGLKEQLLLEAMEWKDEQYEEEKKELRGLVDMLPINENNQTIIEDLKALLS